MSPKAESSFDYNIILMTSCFSPLNVGRANVVHSNHPHLNQVVGLRHASTNDWSPHGFQVGVSLIRKVVCKILGSEVGNFVWQCIGATTLDEYRKHIEKDPALERRFQPVLVPEPTVEETIQILKGLRERYEIHHKLRYTDEALVAAAQLSYQYIRCVLSIHSHNKYVVPTEYVRDLNV